MLGGARRAGQQLRGAELSTNTLPGAKAGARDRHGNLRTCWSWVDSGPPRPFEFKVPAWAGAGLLERSLSSGPGRTPAARKRSINTSRPQATHKLDTQRIPRSFSQGRQGRWVVGKAWLLEACGNRRHGERSDPASTAPLTNGWERHVAVTARPVNAGRPGKVSLLFSPRHHLPVKGDSSVGPCL